MTVEEPQEKRMPLGDHLEELRRRVIYSVIAVGFALLVAILFRNVILRLLMKPVLDALREEFPGQASLVLFSPGESFVVILRVCTYAGIFLASPVVFWQLWKFVSAGLYPRERKYVHIFAPLTFLLFICGTLFSYFLVLRVAVHYLLRIGPQDIFRPQFNASQTLSFVVQLSFGFGLVFETPLVMLFLSKVGVAKPAQFRKFRRYAYLLIFIVAACLTPGPDIYSQFLMAIPMLGLYELGILLSLIRFSRPKQESPA